MANEISTHQCYSRWNHQDSPVTIIDGTRMCVECAHEFFSEEVVTASVVE